MKLPDFMSFEPFNVLRARMGADKLGFFELFDPKYHLTGIERSELNRSGLTVNVSDIQFLLDFTLVYKNSRIWVEDERYYHVANCGDFSIKADTVRIGTSPTGLLKPVPVCPTCLQTLQYKGYDALKARKEAYSRQVYAEFTLSSFWKEHHKYPVSEKRDMRKSFAR